MICNVLDKCFFDPFANFNVSLLISIWRLF
jgi:hypothetical protein